jgi:hypothetical protein
MKKLPSHLAAALAALGSADLRGGFEYRSAQVSIYAHLRATVRPELADMAYCEAYEIVLGGVVFLNGWYPAKRAGYAEFFAELAARERAYVSPRPYKLGQACDGTITTSVLAAFCAACDALGWDASALYAEAYPQERDMIPDWGRCRRDADWQGGVVWPAQWDAVALDGLEHSLTEINYHRLRDMLDEQRSKTMPCG